MQLQLLSVHANGASAWCGNPTSFVRSLQHTELRGEGDAAVHGVTAVETLLSAEEARPGCVKARAAEPAAPALPLQQEGKGFILRVANIPVLQHWLLRRQHQRVFWKKQQVGHLKPLQLRWSPRGTSCCNSRERASCPMTAAKPKKLRVNTIFAGEWKVKTVSATGWG